MDGWEKEHDYSDADCRMTAFLLLDEVLSAESTEEEYEGTYLMFDTEAIDNVGRYETIKEDRDMFTTLYGEKSVTDDKHPEAVFSDSWDQYGFRVDSDNMSLLSIVIYFNCRLRIILSFQQRLPLPQMGLPQKLFLYILQSRYHRC